jgi:hypothetical protein
MKLKLENLKLLAALLLSAFALKSSAQFTMPVYFTNYTMIGTTNDTTINIKPQNNPIGYLGALYSLPFRGTNITTTNGVGVAHLVKGRYTASFAGIPQSWSFTVTNSATPLNVLDITDGDSGIVIYSGVQTLTGLGGITIYPPSGPGGNWSVSNNPNGGGGGGSATNAYQSGAGNNLISITTNIGASTYTFFGVAQTNENMRLWGLATPTAYSNGVIAFADGRYDPVNTALAMGNTLSNYVAALSNAVFALFTLTNDTRALNFQNDANKYRGTLNGTATNATTATTATQLENRGTTLNGFQASISTAGNNGFHISDADGSSMGITGGNILIIWTNASAIAPFELRGIDNMTYLQLTLTSALLPAARVVNLGDGSRTNFTIADLNGGLHTARLGSHLTFDGTTIDATGGGTGDMLAANNLSDVSSKPIALANLGGAATNYGTTIEKRYADGSFIRTNTAPPFNWEFHDANGLSTFGTNSVTKLTLSKNGDVTIVGTLSNVGNGATFSLDGNPAASPGPFIFDATTTSVLKIFGPTIGEMMELNADAQQVTFLYRIFSAGDISTPSLTIDQWRIATNTANHSLVVSNTAYQIAFTFQTNNGLLIGPNAVATINPITFPDNTNGAIYEYDASIIPGHSDGDMITNVTGNYGAGWTNIGTAGNGPPQYKTGVLNGLPVLRFFGTNRLVSTGTFGALNDTNLTVFIVAKHNLNPSLSVMLGCNGVKFYYGRTTPDCRVWNMQNLSPQTGKVGYSFLPWTNGNTYTITLDCLVYDGTTVLCGDGLNMTALPNSGNIGMGNNPLEIGALGGSFNFTGDIGFIRIYTNTDPAIRIQAALHIAQVWGVNITNIPANIVVNGDSTAFGNGLSAGQDPASCLTNVLARRWKTGNFYTENRGVGGQTFSNRLVLISDDIARIVPGGETIDLHLEGINDIAAGFTSSNLEANVKLYGTQYRSAGGWFVPAKLLPRADAGFTLTMETNRLAYNTALGADYPQFADGMFDNSVLMPTSVTNSTVYMQSDKIHPTFLANRMLAVEEAKQIKKLDNKGELK